MGTVMTDVSEVRAIPTGTDHRTQRWMYVVSHTDPKYGGLSSAVPAVAASLAAEPGFEVSVAAFCHPGETFHPGALRKEMVSFWPTSRKTWALNRELKTSFVNEVRQADGLHVHGLWEESTAVAFSAARKLGKPYVLSAHGMLEPWALATKALKKRIYAALIERQNVSGAACLHALTVAEAAQYRSFGATCPIAVIPNAVELPEGADAELFLTRFPDLRGKRVVLFLSRLHPKKGLDLLVDAWASLAAAYPDAHLVIAGPDSEGMQARLTLQAQQAGITDNITFTGMLSGAMKWSALAAAGCYVLPSYSEGLSMALLEAMGMGLPVIATRACNMPEITAAGAGWEIDANAESLTSALADFLRGPDALNWVKGKNGAELIARRYSPGQVTRQMAGMYEFALGGPRPESVAVFAGRTR